MDLKINKMYPAISGEVGGAFPQGTPCMIVRLQGCNLRCSYCDAKETQDPNDSYDLRGVYDICWECDSKDLFPLLTGGEPLLQLDGVIELLKELSTHPERWETVPVQIETNGTIPIDEVVKWDNAYLVMDLKDNLTDAQTIVVYNNLPLLRPQDTLKAIVTDLDSVHKVVQTLNRFYLDGCKAKLAISLVLKNDTPLTEKEMKEYIKIVQFSGSLITLNFQLHKLLNLP